MPLSSAIGRGRAFTATAETAKAAIAKATEWQIVGKPTDVSISDGCKKLFNRRILVRNGAC